MMQEEASFIYSRLSQSNWVSNFRCCLRSKVGCNLTKVCPKVGNVTVPKKMLFAENAIGGAMKFKFMCEILPFKGILDTHGEDYHRSHLKHQFLNADRKHCIIITLKFYLYPILYSDIFHRSNCDSWRLNNRQFYIL